MIRPIEDKDLLAYGRIYTKAFPIEYWGIDWNEENGLAGVVLYTNEYAPSVKFYEKTECVK